MSSLDIESAWWDTCANTWFEEFKQIEYARRMGLTMVYGGRWPAWDLNGKSVLDLGGGPVSMLLKAYRPGHMTVVDPCKFPAWVMGRYGAAGVEYIRLPAEKFMTAETYDECWIYNVLQHVEDPVKVIATALTSAKILRIFEWVNIPGDEKHPHVLTSEDLRRWCGGEGQEATGINRKWGETNNAAAWYGVFES